MTTHSGLDTVIGGTGGKTANPEAAEQCYRKGQEFERAGDRVGACEQYRQAREHDSHDAATFRLAYLLDLLGEEDESMGLFDDMVRQPKPPLNALVNLAILHEDRGEYVRAERLLRQVLETEPNHRRALSFHKDVLASKEMFVDLDTEREKAGNAAVLDTPVTDFELSVRARNCLKKMNIRTLGDLLRISEAELLSYKNFGEQSLVEIKAMLTTKGLRLGQGLEGGKARRDILEQLRGTVPETVLNKPISSLELSVRARKALQLLGVATLGELASRTEAELMGVKNFGQTSLVEIKEKLAQNGLRLRILE
jgi:DNA-directed RNA polymerase subunit alpha